jgi:hypothetical protein
MLSVITDDRVLGAARVPISKKSGHLPRHRSFEIERGAPLGRHTPKVFDPPWMPS